MQYSLHTIPPSNWLGHGLFGCFADCDNCCITCFCPCVTYAENGVMLRGGDTSSCCAECCLYFCVETRARLLGKIRRTDIRHKYNLPPKPCNDCCVHFFCHYCALCEEHRELRIRARGAAGTGAIPIRGQYVPVPEFEAYPPAVELTNSEIQSQTH